jgi:23S rRNA (pseudouridine1915-N3)-methyltransferase
VLLHIIAVGRMGASPEADLVTRYQQRLGAKFKLTEVNEGKPFPPAPPQSRTVVLDETGRAMSSEAFASQLGRWQDEAVREVRFLIGGADGHDVATRQSADLLLAFGPATWPHMLVRAMLTEQLYRARAILDGHPYHRGN